MNALQWIHRKCLSNTRRACPSHYRFTIVIITLLVFLLLSCEEGLIEHTRGHSLFTGALYMEERQTYYASGCGDLRMTNFSIECVMNKPGKYVFKGFAGRYRKPSTNTDNWEYTVADGASPLTQVAKLWGVGGYRCRFEGEYILIVTWFAPNGEGSVETLTLKHMIGRY